MTRMVITSIFLGIFVGSTFGTFLPRIYYIRIDGSNGINSSSSSSSGSGGISGILGRLLAPFTRSSTTERNMYTNELSGQYQFYYPKSTDSPESYYKYYPKEEDSTENNYKQYPKETESPGQYYKPHPKRTESSGYYYNPPPKGTRLIVRPKEFVPPPNYPKG